MFWLIRIIVFCLFLLALVLVSYSRIEINDIFLNIYIFFFWWDISFISKLFSLVVIFISIIVYYWARFYIVIIWKTNFFYLALTGFVLSILLLSIRQRFFSVFIGWEGLGISSFLLVVFYQNWRSVKGASLTLLTNRLGDAILLLSFTYWLLNSSFFIIWRRRIIILILITILSFTKRAQWPFFNWLPAAIAAPTPVRALVHSSTLVTAGLLLLIRFNYNIRFFNGIWFYFGIITLLIARTAALFEKDAKKVIALSTLRQLGLIFIAIRLNIMLCLFHVLTHALAKANLFLIIGSLLHRFYSEQRILNISMTEMNILVLLAFISVFNLIGLLFSSGFFSKEIIICSNERLINRALYLILLIMIISLTFSYCIKLLIYLVYFLKKVNNFLRKTFHILIILRPLILAFNIITFGYFILNRVKFIGALTVNAPINYWLLPFCGLVLIFVKDWLRIYTRFQWINNTIDKLISLIIFTKNINKNLEFFNEIIYILYSLKFFHIILQPTRFLIIISIIIIIIIEI